MTCAHVRLLGPCFKTGRSSYGSRSAADQDWDLSITLEIEGKALKSGPAQCLLPSGADQDTARLAQVVIRELATGLGGELPTGRGVLLEEKCSPPLPANPDVQQNLSTNAPAIHREPPESHQVTMRPESPLSDFPCSSASTSSVSRTLEVSLQSSFHLSLMVLVCYRSRGHI